MELPLSDPFSVVKIACTALLFPLAARDATRHVDDVTDRGHTDPVKNGDAFERLGIMTLLADRKNTVMGSDNFSGLELGWNPTDVCIYKGTLL